MNHNRLLIAVVVFAALTGAVFATMRSHESESTVEKPTATLPKIKKEDVSFIELNKPDKTTIVLTKENGQWKMTAPVAAKADTSAVDSVLEKLADLEVTGIAATRKENHARLQVDADTAIRVKAKAGDKQLADLYIGASKTSGTMVRVEGQDQVVAVSGSIRWAFDKDVKSFRDRVITDVDPAELTAMEFTSEKGTFKLEKPEAKWQQPKGAKAIERFSDSKVQSLASSVARLRAADFADPKETAEQAGFSTPTATVTMTKKDGSKVVVELGKLHANGTEYYLRVQGGDVIYRVSKFTAERMMPDAAAFQEAEKKEGEAAAPAPNPMMGMGGGENQQIPPEVLKQLQQQLQAAH